MARFWLLLMVLIVLFGGGLFVSYLRMPHIISNYLSNRIDAPVELDRFSISRQAIEMDHFTMKNPKGFSLENAIKVDKIQVIAPLVNYLGNPIIIDEISLQDVYVSMILSKGNKTACNWNVLIKMIGVDDSSWYSIKRTALIKKLSLKNITIELVQWGKDPQIVGPIDHAEFLNINVQNGIPTKEISKIIVDNMMSSIFSFTGFLKFLGGLPLDAFKLFSSPSTPHPSETLCPSNPQENK